VNLFLDSNLKLWGGNMKKAQKLGCELGAAMAIAMLATSVAHAQAAANETAGDAAVDSGSGIQDIVVTAQRKSESSQRAAIAIDAVSGESLAQTGMTSATQLQQVSPSLNVANSGGANSSFFVRGVGNFSSNAYTDPATAFNYDGVYIGRPASTAGLFYDLERVEVLKGPQGTLYGRNATAGAINVIPAKPRIGEFSGNFTGSYGNYNAINLQGAVNVPMGEHGALRVSGTVSDHDGYLSDGANDEKISAFRVQMLAELTPELTVKIDGDYAHVGGQGSGAYYAARSTGLNATTQRYDFVSTGLSASTGLLDPISQAYRTTLFSAQVRRNFVPLPSEQYLRDNFYGVSSTIEYKTPAGTLTIIPAYRSAQLDDQHSSAGFTPSTKEKFEQTSLEARFGGTSGQIDYILGAYYYSETVKGNYTFAQQVLSSYQDFTTRTKSYAAFGRLTFHVADNFRLTGGIRYTDDTKNMDGAVDTISQRCSAAACPNAPFIPVTDQPDQLPFAVPARGQAPVPVQVNGVATGAITVRNSAVVLAETKTGKATYRGAAEFDVGPNSMLYASVETGFHSGGFSLATGRESFQPEYITAYTIGSKNRFFDNKLQLNLEGFYWKYSNQQIAHFGIDGAGGQAFFTENVGQSTIKGFEADVEARPARGTMLSASVQYLDAKFDSFKYDIPAANGVPNVGCPSAVNPTNALLRTVDCSGFPSFNSPKWTLTFGAEQSVPLGDFDLVFAADTQFRSERVIAFEYIPPEIAPPVWRSNASITLKKGDAWSISGFVRNIENNRTANSGTLVGAAGVVTLRTNAPRTFGVRVSAKF
jgi:iron complex outermembrane recepter protein